MSLTGLYLWYLLYASGLSRTNIFTLDLCVGVTTCTPVPLVEIYGHVLPWTPVFSEEMIVHALTQSSVHAETSVHRVIRSSVHVAFVHALTQSSVHVLLWASFLVLMCVCVYVHGILQASVNVPPRASVFAVDVPNVCMLFCSTHSYKVNLAMALGHLMNTYGVLLGISCIISRNIQNITPCNGLVKKYAYISPISQYFRDKYPLSIWSFINKYYTQIYFFHFLLDYLQLFFMSIRKTSVFLVHKYFLHYCSTDSLSCRKRQKTEMRL